RANDWTPAADPESIPAPAHRPVLDRWALSRLNQVIAEVDAAYAQFDSQGAGAVLTRFLDDLSNWYVRRSRRRFWRGDPAAMATLHECVEVVTRLLAPVVPFITERVWQDVVRPTTPGAVDSVHLTSFPESDHALVDTTLDEEVALT